MKCEALLQCFLCKLKQKNVFNENVHDKLYNANLSSKFLVSYDVTSLFTNILLQETIDIAINLIFSHNPNRNITKRELDKPLRFAISQTF